ncbi:MAG TPA: molybdopterin cofactor-binding domain-containing protein [Casimicrobiaceae bacterium]|nr:molybdopterin cofactor-binding domain-containing protein [Casimicrobiaceae bacterium]
MNLAVDPARAAAAGTPLPGSLRVNRRLSQWLKFHREGYVEVFSGKVEIGQGILTALKQIVAEELDVSLAKVRMSPACTAVSPDEAVTSGSRSIEESGTALHHACAEARAIYLSAAAERLGVPVASLSVVDGNIVASGGARTSYWELADDRLLDREATGEIAPKPAEAQHVVGMSVPRLDLPDKVFGVPCFIHDFELKGMVHGRMLRPPSAGATLQSVDETAARAVPGVIDIVRDGSLIGLLAESEAAAEAALSKLSARWSETPILPDENALGAWLRAQEVETSFVAGNAPSARPPVARTVKASYSRPYLAHASIGPSCALAQWHGSKLHVWTHSQGIFNLRRDLMLALHASEVVVEHVQGAGCYGHNGADDVAFDAAWLARAAAGRPVRVQWSRADELAWAPFGPAMAIDLEADLAADGAIVGWRHTLWSNGHTSRPGRADSPALLGAWHLAKPFERKTAINPPLAGGGGAERNAVPIYALPAWQMINHHVLEMPLRASALRSLGAYANVFAVESFIDELAIAAGESPVGFRLRHLADRRARAVIERAAIVAGWNQWARREGAGHGLGFARYKNAGAYCAVIAEIEADAEVRVRRLTIAVDAGRVINPDGVANQIEGGAIQATSWTLKEAVRFDRSRVVSDSWEAYPILRFSEVPAVQVEIVPRPDCGSVGVGEAAQGPTAAAIANALFDALGVRVRSLPLTAERIRAAISSAP